MDKENVDSVHKVFSGDFILKFNRIVTEKKEVGTITAPNIGAIKVLVLRNTYSLIQGLIQVKSKVN